MKKKGIIILIIALLAVIVTSIVINKNNRKYIMQDGMMLALSLDGSSIISFPERGAYNIEIDCGNTAKGIWLVEDWKLGVEDITENVKCNISFTTNPTTLKSKVETVNANQNYNSHGYRYSGKTPSNWVWFNGEKWRIIGSIPTKQSNGTTGNLVKIIRNEPIGAYAYDASSTSSTSLKGAWGKNTLYSLLNTHYYASDATKMNGQSHAGCYGYYSSAAKPKPNCDYSEIGILLNSYYGKMVKNVYWNTGASSISVTPSVAYTNEIKTQTVSGYVGLMTASDWGYAASSSFHSLTMDKYTSGTNNATETSWIFNNGYEWTSIMNSTGSYRATYVASNGTLTEYNLYNGYAVRPVVYLDSSVYIISGDGTEGNPYQIDSPFKITPIFNGSNMSIYVDDGSTSFTYNAGGTISCTSSNTWVATCSNDSTTKTITITPISSGTTTITITSTEDPLYEAGSVTYTIEVFDFGLPDEEEIPEL